MTALALLDQVAAAGVQVRIVGADLAIRPKGCVEAEYRGRPPDLLDPVCVGSGTVSGTVGGLRELPTSLMSAIVNCLHIRWTAPHIYCSLGPA